MSALVPDPEAAIDYLEKLRSGGPWVLTAITPEGPVSTETFYKPDAAARWIERENASRNIYCMAAEARRALRKKACKGDVARSRHLWADIDGDGDLLGRLNGHVPQPSMIVASGGGLNVYWALGCPVDDVAEIEAHNRWLSDNLGADHCWNADRILRLPGTINWPNAKKKRQGRVPVLSRCVERHPDRVYDAAAFGRIEEGEAKQGQRVDLGDDVQLLTLDELPAEVLGKLSPSARRLIHEGPQPDEYQGDRSKAVFAVTGALVRANASDAQIAAILLNPELPLHAHIADQKGHGPRAYVARQIERVRARVARDAAATAHGAALAAGLLGDNESDHSAEAAAENANPHVGLPYDAALILQPGGILQTFADWMTSTAKRPQPMLALGASTALVGLLSAHKYRLVYNGNDTRTNVAIVCLAASSAGKDHPRRSVKRVMAEVGMQEFVGEDLASGQALEGTFIKYFAHLFMIDEYGHRIRAALDPKGNPNEKKIVEVVTKLSTSAAGPYVHSRMAMNRDSDVPLTWDPCLVMFNTTVEAPLWEGMHSGHVNDGSIARHLYFKTDADYPDNARDVPHFEERLPEMVHSALRILTGDPGNELALVSRRNGLKAVYGPADKFGRQERKPPLKPELITLPIDAEAKVELRRLEEEELALLREHQPRGTNALVGRLVEHATRLALICAVSDSPDGPVVGARHVRWGEAVAKRSIDTVLRAAATNIADTPHQANRNKLLRDIHRVAGGGWATARDVTRASQWCKTKDRNELLAELVDIGLVAFRSTKRGSQAVVEYRCQ